MEGRRHGEAAPYSAHVSNHRAVGHEVDAPQLLGALAHVEAELGLDARQLLGGLALDVDGERGEELATASPSARP
jgi:hypothetical protein